MSCCKDLKQGTQVVVMVAVTPTLNAPITHRKYGEQNGDRGESAAGKRCRWRRRRLAHDIDGGDQNEKEKKKKKKLSIRGQW